MVYLLSVSRFVPAQVCTCLSECQQHFQALILRRAHTLVCDRLEGWPRIHHWPNLALGHPSRRIAIGKRPTAMLLRMRAGGCCETCVHAIALSRGRTERGERSIQTH